MPSSFSLPALVLTWLTGRSVARGLPAPVADRGGFRVDTGSDTEAIRWVFPAISNGLIELGRSVRAPRHFVKSCVERERLRAALPGHWRMQDPGFFMMAAGPFGKPSLVPGYGLETVRHGQVIQARIIAADGSLAASGYAAELADAMIYDRIVTAPAHQRLGLGTMIMTALQAAKRNPGAVDLLVATEAGRQLYTRLGWRLVAPYSSASTTGD